jgi:hypothetical protein
MQILACWSRSLISILFSSKILFGYAFGFENCLMNAFLDWNKKRPLLWFVNI